MHLAYSTRVYFVDYFFTKKKESQIITNALYLSWFSLDANKKILSDAKSLETSLKEKCQTVSDFESNIRLIKNRGQEIERITEFEYIDAVKIDLTPLSSSLHRHNQLWYDSLINVLQSSIHDAFDPAEDFLDSAFKEIAYQPKSAEETTLAAQQYGKINSQANEIKSTLSKTTEKVDLLRHVDSFSANRLQQRLGSILDRMDQLLLALENQKQALSKTIEALKASIQEETDTFQDTIKSLSARFEIAARDALQNCQVSRSNRELSRKWITDIESFSEDLELAKEDFTKLQKKLAAFELPPISDEQITNFQTYVENVQKTWSIFKDYDTQLQKMEEKKWLVMRDELGNFEDFCISWEEKLRKIQKKDSISLGVAQEIEKFREAMVGFKTMKGENLGETHWAELFRMLGMESGMDAGKLVFGQVLDKTELIIKNAVKIKVSYSKYNRIKGGKSFVHRIDKGNYKIIHLTSVKSLL